MTVHDRRHIDWRLGWIDRRRQELQTALADLDAQEREVLGLIASATPIEPTEVDRINSHSRWERGGT